MKSLIVAAIAGILFSTGCTDIPFAIPEKALNGELVHFGIYIELLPDSTLNQDERCWQADELREMSRSGYDITLYQVFAPPKGEAASRHGTTNNEGNYNAHDLPPATYRIVATDAEGISQEATITPAKGAITRKTFSFNIRKN